MFMDRGCQLRVVCPGVRKNNVVYLLAYASLGKLFNEPSLGCARPWPRPYVAETFFIDVDNNEASLIFVLGSEPPSDVSGTFVNLGKPRRREELKAAPHQKG
jgi:hypothetical protein